MCVKVVCLQCLVEDQLRAATQSQRELEEQAQTLSQQLKVTSDSTRDDVMLHPRPGERPIYSVHNDVIPVMAL